MGKGIAWIFWTNQSFQPFISNRLFWTQSVNGNSVNKSCLNNAKEELAEDYKASFSKGAERTQTKDCVRQPFSFLHSVHPFKHRINFSANVEQKKLTINGVTERHEWLNKYYGMWRWHVGGQTPLPPFFRLYHGCLWYLVGPSVRLTDSRRMVEF